MDTKRKKPKSTADFKSAANQASPLLQPTSIYLSGFIIIDQY